jgi:membrane protease subunit HflK
MTLNAGHAMSPNPPQNPWSQPSGAGPRGPHFAGGFRPGKGGGQTPPPFSSGGFKGPQPPKSVFILAGIGFIALWVLSGLYRVLPEENAVIMRFGQYTNTIDQAGLHYHLPWPVETVIKPNVTFERRIEIGYRSMPFDDAQKQDVPEESLMLTGDANIVDLDFVVQWKIANAREFLFNIRDPQETLKRVAESAMREVAGQNKLQDIITDRREDVGARVRVIMQQILDTYGAGIMVSQVLIQNASVPSAVSAAFEDVIRASQDAETLKNQATRYRNEIVPRAEGDAIRLIKEAEAYRAQIVSQAKGDADRFTKVYGAYAQAKGVTRERLYLEAWDHMLKNSDAVLLDSKTGSSVPYVNVNELRAKRIETNTEGR